MTRTHHGWEARIQGLGFGLTFTILPTLRLIAVLGPIVVGYGRDKSDD